MSTDVATAAVAVDTCQTELQRLPVPDVGPDEGLLQVEAAGVCGTDWEYYTRSRGEGLGPLILGHENVGTIAEIGERAAQRWGVEVGDRVAVEEFIPCGRCALCRGGNYRICEATDHRSGRPFLRYGATSTSVPPGLWGGFSELLYLHPSAIVYPVADHVDPGTAALFVPISNGIRWVVQEGGGQVGDALVVQGPGQHGLGCVIAGRVAGMDPIVVIGLARDRERLEAAHDLGATLTVAADTEDARAAVMEATGGGGADVVIDVTPGSTQPVELALEIAAKRASIVLAGSKHGKPIAGFSNDTVVRKEVTVRGVRGHDHRSVVPALGIIASGRYDLERLVTHSLDLDGVDEALRIGGERTEPGAIHVNVVPTS